MDMTARAPIPKTVTTPSAYCPWASRQPIMSSAINKNVSENTQAAHKTYLNCSHKIQNQTCINNHSLENNHAMQFPSIHQSSTQFVHFLRLMQLFPDVHPATLHTVLVLCKNNFFCAVDKLLYAKKCKEAYNSRVKVNRYQPYQYASSSTSSGRRASPNDDGWQNCTQVAPLDVSSNKSEREQEQTGLVQNKDGDVNKIKNIFIDVSPISSNDLLPVASPKCQLPIRPLSPITNEFSPNASNQMII